MNKTTYKQISNYIANELKVDRNEIKRILKEKVDRIDLSDMVRQAVDKYFHKGSNGYHAGTIVENRIIELVDKEIQKRICETVRKQIDEIAIIEAEKILSIANKKGSIEE